MPGDEVGGCSKKIIGIGESVVEKNSASSQQLSTRRPTDRPATAYADGTDLSRTDAMG